MYGLRRLLIDYLFLCSISKNTMYNLLEHHLEPLLFEIVFPLMCFNDNDQMLWDEDPHEYVRKGYGMFDKSSSSCLDNPKSYPFYNNITCSIDIIEDLYSPRTASMDFVTELVRKRGKDNFPKFMQFIVNIFKKYVQTSSTKDRKGYYVVAT